MIAQWCSQLRDVCEESVHKQIHEIVSKVKEKGFNLESTFKNWYDGQDRKDMIFYSRWSCIDHCVNYLCSIDIFHAHNM